jgi:DNA-binding NarL/FixJ family response regulator
MTPNQNIRILLVEDHLIVREGLQLLLNTESDITVVGEASDGREAVEMAGNLKPDVIIMDIAMPRLNGIEATRQIHHDFPDIKVIILSANSDDAYVEKVMALGAKGYLIKQTSVQYLSEAVREVYKGKLFYSPDIAKKLSFHSQNSRDRNGDIKNSCDLLSSRETEVLQLIAEGFANKNIGSSLNISIKTVEKHRNTLKNKLDIYDTAGLTCYAIKSGVIEMA